MNSMTGFGRSVSKDENYVVEVEIKSVNHRFLDLAIRLPKECNRYELKVRELLGGHLLRGRIECFIKVMNKSGNDKEVIVHWQLLDQLMQELEQASEERYAGDKQFFSQMTAGLATIPEFFEIAEKALGDTSLEDLMQKAVNLALVELIASRNSEGIKINQFLQKYLIEFSILLEQLYQEAEKNETEYQERLIKKVLEIVPDSMDENRVLTEVALLIERGDIQEELDRLSAHIKKLTEIFNRKGAVGREADFLIQEMNREVNTAGSKSARITIKNIVIQMKTLLEKIREQIQNIE